MATEVDACSTADLTHAGLIEILDEYMARKRDVSDPETAFEFVAVLHRSRGNLGVGKQN